MRINNFISQGFQSIQQSGKVSIPLSVMIAYIASTALLIVAVAFRAVHPILSLNSYTITHFNKLSFDPQNKQEKDDVEFLKKNQNFVLPNWMSLVFNLKKVDQTNQKTLKWNKRGEIIKNLLKIDDFEKLPILNIQRNKRLKDLDPQDLSDPLMKGIDKNDCPFLAFRLEDNQNSQVFVYTLFQEGYDDYNDVWRVTSNYNNASDVLSGIVYPPNPHGFPHLSDPRIEELAVLSQIIQHQHNRFVLV